MKNETILIIFTTLILALTIWASCIETRHFNNGYCYNCGTKYQALSRSQAGTYYECPDCYFGTYY